MLPLIIRLVYVQIIAARKQAFINNSSEEFRDEVEKVGEQRSQAGRPCRLPVFPASNYPSGSPRALIKLFTREECNDTRPAGCVDWILWRFIGTRRENPAATKSLLLRRSSVARFRRDGEQKPTEKEVSKEKSPRDAWVTAVSRTSEMKKGRFWWSSAKLEADGTVENLGLFRLRWFKRRLR